MNILECVIYDYLMRRTDCRNTVSDHITELLLNVPADNKYHAVKARLDRIMDRVVHDDVTACVNGLQLFDTAAEAGADTSSHNQ